MRLYRRKKRSGDWVWWVSFTDHGVTRRLSTKCSTRAAAELVVARWERELADPVHAAAKEATLGSEFLIYEAELAGARRSAATLAIARTKAGVMMRLLGSEAPLADLTAERIDDAFRQRRDEGVKDMTLLKEWSILRGILKSARRRGRYHIDPSTVRPHWLDGTYRPRERFLPPWEILALLGELEPMRQAPVCFALATGARLKEVFGAHPEDVSGELESRAGRTFVQLRGSKTAKSRATIQVPRVFRPLLLRAVPFLPFEPWPESHRDLRRACKRAGIEPVSWNDLRRTFASLLVQLGVPIDAVARLLRHTTPTLAYKTYGQHTPASLGELVDAQLGVLTGGVVPRLPPGGAQ